MESNVNGGQDTQLIDSSPLVTKCIVEQRSNEDTGKHGRFSIRAYVAEIREKDWKICWPFCSTVEFYEDKDCKENVDKTSYEYLPLMDLVRKGKSPSAISNTKIRHNLFVYGENEKDAVTTVDVGIPKPTCTRRKDIELLNEGIFIRDTETTNLDGGEGSNSGILDFEFAERKLKCKRTCSNEKGMNPITHFSESESMESGSSDSQTSSHRNLCSLKSNGDDQNKDTECAHGEQQLNEFYSSTKQLKCKRPQKVRLLSDILRREIPGGSCDLSSSNGTVDSGYMGTRVTNTEAADDSDDLTLGTLFRSRKDIQPNSGRITGRNNKKRFQVEDLAPDQSRSSNGESEVLLCQNSNKENSVQSVIGSSTSVKTAISREFALLSQTEKRQRKSSCEGRQTFSKMSRKNLCQELLLVDKDPKSTETPVGAGNRQFHFPDDAPTISNLMKPNGKRSHDFVRKSISHEKEGKDKGSLMLPHEFVPLKKRAGGVDERIGPYVPGSNKGSDSPHHLKNKHGTVKRKKGSSFSCDYENNKVARANSEVTKIPSSELDDIPMDIVKLLAENRRERRLLEAETAEHDTLYPLRSANQSETPHRGHPTRAYDDVTSTDLKMNTFQVQRKPFRVGGDTFNETQSSVMAVTAQGQDPRYVCFPNVGKNTTKISGTQISAMSSSMQSKPLDFEIYNKKTVEKPCACVQKKIGISSKADLSLTTQENESMPAMQLLRLMEAGMSSMTSDNAGSHKISDTHKMPFPTHIGGMRGNTFGETMLHIGSTERNNNPTQIGGMRSEISGNIVLDTDKFNKRVKIKSSVAALQAMNGRVNGHVSGKNNLGTDYISFSSNKGESSAWDYTVLPAKASVIKGTVKQAEVKKRKKSGEAWAVKGNYGSEICSVNRNPADFSIPGTGNKFMRRGRNENSRNGKPKLSIGKMAGSMKELMPTCVA